MDRRLVLAALWVVFAVASVGVGFAAAGLVGDPFTDSGSDVVATGARPAFTTTGTPAASGSASTSGPSGSTTRSHPASTASATKARPSTGSTGSRTSTAPSTAPPATGASTARGINTRAGYVSGTCRDGLVALGASPAVGWRIDEITPGRTTDGSVHFAQTGGEGEVEVTARCVSGVPRFAVDDHRGGGGSGSGGGGDG